MHFLGSVFHPRWSGSRPHEAWGFGNIHGATNHHYASRTPGQAGIGFAGRVTRPCAIEIQALRHTTSQVRARLEHFQEAPAPSGSWTWPAMSGSGSHPARPSRLPARPSAVGVGKRRTDSMTAWPRNTTLRLARWYPSYFALPISAFAAQKMLGRKKSVMPSCHLNRDASLTPVMSQNSMCAVRSGVLPSGMKEPALTSVEQSGSAAPCVTPRGVQQKRGLQATAEIRSRRVAWQTARALRPRPIACRSLHDRT